MKGEGHDIHIILSFLADLITAVEFDPTGNYLATGDRSGRVVLFERNDDVSKSVNIKGEETMTQKIEIRHKDVNTSSIPSSSRMKPNLII